MSFDIFLQAFRDGEAAPGDGAAALAILDPLVVERNGASFAVIRTADGTADVYGLATPDRGFLFNHVEGRAAWDVIYAVAHAARFVVMPVGCDTLLVDAAQRDELPDELHDDVRVISSGAELLAALED